MTAEQLQKIGLAADASPQEIDDRLDELAAGAGNAAQPASDKPYRFSNGIEIPADIDKDDVLWRVTAGLQPHQAIDAARAQKLENARNGGAK